MNLNRIIILRLNIHNKLITTVVKSFCISWCWNSFSSSWQFENSSLSSFLHLYFYYLSIKQIQKKNFSSLNYFVKRCWQFIIGHEEKGDPEIKIPDDDISDISTIYQEKNPWWNESEKVWKLNVNEFPIWGNILCIDHLLQISVSQLLDVCDDEATEILNQEEVSQLLKLLLARNCATFLSLKHNCNITKTNKLIFMCKTSF